MSNRFTDSDLRQMSSLELSEEAVEKQIENFRKGFPKLELLDAATVDNGGILRLDDSQIDRYTKSYKQAIRG